MGTLNLDVILYILMLFLPPLDAMPLGEWGSLLATECLVAITAAMQASRIWYGAAIATGALWGGLMVLARTRRQWLALNALAGEAPRRLMYRDGLPNDMLDAVLPKACAVYAPACSSWRHWGMVFEGREMPFAEVILLRPSEHFKPNGRLETPTRPFVAPNLRIFYIASPCTVIANALDTLAISNCAPDQLSGALKDLRSLRRLEIRQVHSDEPVDWTALLALGEWLMLEELRIVCRERQSYALACRAVALPMPRLRELYTTAAVFVDAPLAQQVHMVYVRYVDYLRVLQRTPSVVRTTLRASANVALPLMSSSAWPGAGSVYLGALESLKVFGDVEQYGPDFFHAITAPNADIHVDCNMSAPPNQQAVVDVDALLRTALCAADADVPELRRALQHAKRAFKISGHSALLARLDVLLEDNTPDLSMGEMGRSVQSFSNSVRELVDNPIVSHAEYVLAQVIAATGLCGTELKSDCSMEIQGQADSVRYAVAIREPEGFTRKLTAHMISPRSSGGWTGRARWERRDSLTWAASRMLTGFSEFVLKEVAIVDNGCDPFETLVQPNGDVEALASSLEYLSAMHTLRFKFNTAATGMGMIQAIGTSNLPALTSIYVEGASIGGWGGHHSVVPSYRVWFDTLEVALRRRKEAGRQVELLSIKGRLCLCQFWVDRVRALVDALRMEVACTRGVGEVCVFCSTSAGDF